MHYLVYKTTCLLNGKFYIGKHQTKNRDDGYAGSGTLLRQAIQQYGAENFVTEILGEYDAAWKMKLAERILVVRDPEVSYNVYPGGGGDFSYINRAGIRKFAGRQHSLDTRQIITAKLQGNTNVKKGTPSPLRGYKFGPASEEARANMKAAALRRGADPEWKQAHVERMKCWWAKRKSAGLA